MQSRKLADWGRFFSRHLLAKLLKVAEKEPFPIRPTHFNFMAQNYNHRASRPIPIYSDFVMKTSLSGFFCIFAP
jgi:hypothetical protein